MLASRYGYVCRSCRAKTEAVLQHEQRRRWTDGRGQGRRSAIGKGVLRELPIDDGVEASRNSETSRASHHGTAVQSTESLKDGLTWREHVRGGQESHLEPKRKARPRSRLARTNTLLDRHVQRGKDAMGGLQETRPRTNASESLNLKYPSHRDGMISQAVAKPSMCRHAAAMPAHAWESAVLSPFVPDNYQHHGVQARTLHTARPTFQQAAFASESSPEIINAEDGPLQPPQTYVEGGIRAHLRKWQELHGDEEEPLPATPQDDVIVDGTPFNDFGRLPDETRTRIQAEREDLEQEQEAASAFNALQGKEGYDGSTAVEDARFLVPGDLVDIEFNASERESILAVYIRPIGSSGNYAQFFTMQGKWLHQSERAVQYRLAGFADTATLNKIIPHLPCPENMAEVSALQEKAYSEDLSVPREVAAPLVARLVKFYDESQEIYRLHASTLDDAHSTLAHDTDLWYGTITSAASTLLKIPAASLSQPAVYAVRKALVHAGFAFNIDRRSHRQTGFFQIRSKASVRNVEQVRHWVRQWQDDLAKTAGMSKHEMRYHKPSAGAKHVYGFLEKSRAIVSKSRETREPTQSGNLGISRSRFPIDEETDSVKLTLGYEFTKEEQEIVRFMEAWACTNMFIGLPRIESLPPLLLHGTGLYPDTSLKQSLGFMFLQELGTLLPYENRVRFDQHLLLPSSQHSKPLQNLMTKLIAMRDSHDFQDSMAGLRHDWKDLPVYCIDSADAQEIDDGISVEFAGKDADGRDQHWVHIHIANPTAFFDRNHPLAKMARHMGETIYMPERTYMMLPRWATQKHFSLAPNRPCLTFSARMNADGKTLEQKITPGIIRNVIRITYDEIATVLGDASLETKHPLKTYTVGGTPPAPQSRKSPLPDLQQHHTDQLKALSALAQCRAELRKSAGGLFFDTHRPEIRVWQTYKHSGLAWDHPHREGSRKVEGDPVIQMKTRGLSNWFAPTANNAGVLVQEFMLMACEISASWCAERDIPIIYRGTVNSAMSEREKANFMKDKIAPNTSADGEYPMWLGVQYLRTVGYTALRTEPISHEFLGMTHYSKATSPLRRYGDMILHWQIEAALRYEASTGQSLVTSERESGHQTRPLQLPFSKAGLESIMLGLQPREQIVAKSKNYADQFWTSMLIFRKHHFGEDGGFDGLPTRELEVVDPDSKEVRMEKVTIFRVFVANRPDPHAGQPFIGVWLMEFGIVAALVPVQGGEEVRLGDIWECRMDMVDVFNRRIILRAISLVAREAM